MADIDVKYLREKGVPVLLESLAAEIVAKKPANPELFLKEKFSLGDDGVIRKSEPVRVYGTALDVYTTIALLAAGYSRTPVEYIEVDGVTPNPTFAQLSPFSRVPVLDNAGTVIVEAGPITRALCSRTAALPLAARENCRIDTAFETIMTNVVTDVARVLHERLFSPRQNNRPVDALNVAAAIEVTNARLQQVNSHPSFFRDSHWVVGTELSIADIALAAAIFALQHTAGVNSVSGLERLQRWWTVMQQQEFFVESLRGFSAAALQLHSGK